ncbi:MAG TPA: condensation domain-containing protein, partial [Thermoanaerobaculia bacterium]|nr:condensation domain-containing protein [Thermoanaerobaculia bacterium]
LPDYMVPARLVRLDALPLTPNGKVDREALPAPGDDARRGRRHTAPRTPTEELVAALWGQLLGVEDVAVEDDFFRLGGHSLLATRLLSRLRGATAAEIPLSDLFDAPTVAGLARRVEARLRAGEDGGEAPDTAIPRRAGPGPAPLSFAQERLWFLDRLTPGDASYNIARALRIEGPLDAAALAGALAAATRRHEVLRTRFDASGGRPVQVPDLPPAPLPLVDLRGLAGTRGVEEAAAALGRAESRRPFDLARGPLLRAALLLLGERNGRQARVLLLTLHHSVADGRSMPVLYRDLETAYRRLAAPGAGEPPAELPPLPLQYADFAVWQRGDLAGPRLERLLDWWRERLAGAPPASELPVDRPRPRVLSGRGAREARPLPAGLSGAVADLALRRGATPFMVYLAAFAALVHRYSGRTDLVLGTPMANRARTEAEGLVGFFANTLVLRLDAGGDPPFEELVARVRAAVLGAHAHQEVPFEKLVDELAPERDLSRTPLFQLSFQVEEAEGDRLDLPGLEVRRLDLARAETKFDLSLALTPGPSGLLARAQYATDLFDATRIRRLLAHLGRLLESAVARPDLPLSALPLMAAAQRQQVVAEWNDTGHLPYRSGTDAAPLHALFEAQAARTPDAVALAFEGRAVTYAELEAASGRWARRLCALGVGPDVLVGACLERSVEMVVGLLALLRAGGAYLPLDPSHPAERLAFMLDDADVALVLT